MQPVATRRVYVYLSLSFVAVGRYDEIGSTGLAVGETEYAGARCAGHLGLDVTAEELDRVVIGTQHLVEMAELRRSVLRHALQSVEQRHYGHRAEILRAASAYVVGVTESLYARLVVIVRTHAVALGTLGLRGPEVHAVRHKYGRHTLP